MAQIPTASHPSSPSGPPSSLARGALLKGLRVQFHIIRALIVRDMLMRYGRSNIGFVWAILEPMILTIGVMFVWSTLKSPYEHGFQIVAVVFTGYMPLTLFRHFTQVGTFLFRRSITLLYHRHISLIDVLLARLTLEFAATSAAMVTVYLTLTMSGFIYPAADPGLMLLGWLYMALLSFGLSALFAVLSEYSDIVERIVPPFQYITVPLSGAFFMVDWIPKTAQDLIWYVPLVHCYEMFRAGYFGDKVVTYYSFWYPLVWALGLIWLGFVAMDKVRGKLHGG
jgi:capsular polysaccharide transport system permease protein